MDLNQLIEICKDPERRDSKLKNITKDAIADILANSNPRGNRDVDDLKEFMKEMKDEMKELRKTNT